MKKKIAQSASAKPFHIAAPNLPIWPYLLLLTLAVGVIYIPTIWFEYVNIDDAGLIYSNPTVNDPNMSNGACFSQFIYTPYYKPLVFFTWRLEYQLLGPNAGHFHLFNWILHLFNTLLVFWVGITLFGRIISDRPKQLLAAFFLALLFSVNPLRVESVTWVTERKDVLFSFFLLLSWVCYLQYLKSSNYLFMILGALLYLCSGLSKSMGIPFVTIIFLFDFYYGTKWSFRQVLAKMPYYISFLALLVLYGFFNFLFHKSGQAPAVADDTVDFFVEAENRITSLPYVVSLPEWLQVLVTTCARVVLWIIHCFIPLGTSIIYSHNEVYGYIGRGIFLYPVLLFALFYFSWRVRKSKSYWLAGLLFYVISLAPVLAVPDSGQAIFLSDRYTYIPSIGLFFILVAYVMQAVRYKALQYVVLGAVSLFFFMESLRVVGNWKNSETLFSRALEIYPASGLAHLNLGLYYRQQKDYDRALEVYTEGIKYSKGYLQLYINRSRILLDRGQADLALQDLDYCLSKSPNLVNALTNRGVAHAMKREWEQSLVDLNKADSLQPNTSDILSNRALVYYSVNRFPDAVRDLVKYIELNPEDADNINLLGLAYLNTNRNEEAMKSLNRAIELKPREAAFYFNRSLVYRNLKDKKSELADLLKAKNLGHPVPEGYINELK